MTCCADHDRRFLSRGKGEISRVEGKVSRVIKIKQMLCLLRYDKNLKNILTSSNHRLGSAGLNALEELLFRCWQ